MLAIYTLFLYRKTKKSKRGKTVHSNFVLKSKYTMHKLVLDITPVRHFTFNFSLTEIATDIVLI